ncbi:MAG: hypothetical protein ACLUVV_00985 [Christensenellales bacterium]
MLPALPLCHRIVKIINIRRQMPDAVGIPEDQLRIAAQKAVCKISIDSICAWP